MNLAGLIGRLLWGGDIFGGKAFRSGSFTAFVEVGVSNLRQTWPVLAEPP